MKKTANLTITHPNLAKEWHPTKNGNLLPTMVTKGQSIKVWWLCEKGHEWVASLNSRSNAGSGCPICHGKQVLQGYNDLATTNPNIAKEWHPTKNGNLLPTMITKGYGKKIWWLAKCGHEWDDYTSNRIKGCGCPICAGKRVLQGYNDLATTNPNIAKEWHPTKNGNLLPTMKTKGSNTKVWWLAECGHEWQTTINHRTRDKGIGCPYCSNKKVLKGFNDLATTNPTLAKEWHPTKNGVLLPTMVQKRTEKKAWWQCKKGHEWSAYISSRDKGAGCPYCSGRFPIIGETDLATTNPSLAKEWHPTKNGNKTATMFSKGAKVKVWWQCKNGHNWQAYIYARTTNGSGCPYCKNCNVPRKSKAHKYVLDMLETCHIKYIPEFRPTTLKKYPYDVYLPTKKCLIEIDGEFHYKFSNMGSLEKRKKIDDKKTKFALDHNIPLLRIPTSIYNKNPEKFRYYINEFIDKKTIHKDVVKAIQQEEQRNPYGNLYLETLLK